MRQLLREDQVVAGAAARRVYDSDAYGVDRFPPAVVVLPESTAEVASVVRWCHQQQVPFTPRGAGTGLSGGVMPALGGVVISIKRLDRILAVEPENRLMHAQAGCVNLALTRAAHAHGLHFAPDPSSQSVATLGGNIGMNSGGPHTLKYGVTAPHIRQVTMVDPTGEVLTIGTLAPGSPGPHFLSVVIGSEGTLGVITEAWVNLTPNPAGYETALASFRTVRDATQSVADIIALGVTPAALEFIDRKILEALKAAFGLESPSDAEAVLLVECDGDPGPIHEEMRQIREVLARNGAIQVETAANPAERQRLWTARKKAYGAMGRLAPTVVTHDGVIPRSKLPEMLDFVYRVAEEHGVGVANMFHAGDGNLHPVFYFDDREPGMIDRVVRAGEAIIRQCVALGGSVTGEHGVGIEKVDLLALMFNESDRQMMADVKQIFGDTTLCNPCKVLPSQKGCLEHMRRWRGAAW